MARFMERENIQIQQVFCSSAARARQTCDIALPDLAPDPVVTHDLYMATPGEMLALLQREAHRDSPVMLVGHNPGMESLAEFTSGTGPSELMDLLARKFPTGALAEIQFDVESWAAVKPHSGTLRRFVRPKDLPEAASERL
jgi:phosphohistidine phosphatase